MVTGLSSPLVPEPEVSAADAALVDGAPVAALRPGPRWKGRSFSLSSKLMLLTIVFVMLSEIATFIPSIANYRTRYFDDRLATAQAANVLLGSTAWSEVPRDLQDDLLDSVGAIAIVVRTGAATRLLSKSDMPPAIDETADLRNPNMVDSIRAAFDTLVNPVPRVVRVIGPTVKDRGLELVLSDAPLRAAMLHFAGYILTVSALISVLTAGLVYFSLQRLFVRPIRRLLQEITRYAADPEDRGRIILPSGRADEIGAAEERLATMQRQLSDTLAQKRHLAELGLAISKVNHDLRNLLASAQLFSDRIGALPDPTVQRFAPKLIATLDRAIDYCQTTLAYGRAQERDPRRRVVALHRVVRDVSDVLGLDQQTLIRFEMRIEAAFEIDADPDQLFRVLMNLCRNAMQAMEGGGDDPSIVRRLTVSADRQGSVALIRVQDTGPGVPPRAKAHLFQAFQGGSRPGGTGLGLAIAAEILRAHGGTIELLDEAAPGAHFVISIPDRPVSFDRAMRARAG